MKPGWTSTTAFQSLRIDSGLRVALGIFGALVIVYVTQVLPESAMRIVDYYVAEFVLLSTLLALIVSAARSGVDKATRDFWHLFAVAIAFWMLARILSFFLREDSPRMFEFIKDVLLLAMYFVLVAAAELRPGFIMSSLQRLRAKLAAVSSILLIAGLFGYFALVPAASGLRDYESPFAIYAILDAYIAVRFYLQARDSSSPSWRLALRLVATGFALMTVSDLLEFAFRESFLTYRPGQLLNLVWFLFYLPLFAATRFVPRSPQIMKRGDEPIWSDALNLAPLLAFTIAIPLLHLGGYGLGVMEADSRTARDLFVLAWLSAAAIGIRWQYMILRARLADVEAARDLAEKESLNLQAQLRQSQRLDLMSHLTGGIAHEFGNSLFGAETYASKILRDARELKTGVKEEHAQGLVNALASSRELVKKFGYLSHGVEPQSTFMNLVQEVNDTVELLRPGIPPGMSLELDVSDERIGVIARKQDLQQIVMNLVLNARDALGTAGRIHITVGQGVPAVASCASCGELVTGERAWLEVSDDGPGIAEGLRQRVFEPLVSTKSAGSGSGLGLSVVHTIVHQLGGHIVLQSGPGCTFSVLLPAAQADLFAIPSPAVNDRFRVLIIESDHVIANQFRRNKALYGVHVNCVSSVDAATVFLRQSGIRLDAVLIGNMQSPIDVITVAQLAHSSLDAPVRVIHCSNSEQHSIVANIDAIDVFLDQPFDDATLAAVVLNTPYGTDPQVASNSA